jgi:LacI family transcriptional regulator
VGIVNLLDEKLPIPDFNLPMVSINKSDYGPPQAQILPDIYNGAYLAANHLLNQGAKKIALILGEAQSTVYGDMENGFKATFTSNTARSFKIVKCELNKEILKLKFEQIINEKIPFDGIVTCNNDVAIQLHAFLHSKNIKIPDDVMLIGFGNETFVNLVSPGISTIEYSSENMGRVAAKVLTEIIITKNTEHKLLIEPAKLIIRASSLKIFQG